MNAFEKLLAEVKANTVNDFTDAFKEVKPSVNPAFIEVELPKKPDIDFEEEEEEHDDDIQDWDDLCSVLEDCSPMELRSICLRLSGKPKENYYNLSTEELLDIINSNDFYDALRAYNYVMY